MKSKSFLWILLGSLLWPPVVDAQEIISFDPRGLVLGIDLGAASYDGDLSSAYSEVNTGLGLEAYYKFSRQMSAGLSFATSKFGVFEDNRNSLGLGFRYRMLRDRVSPYVGLGAQIVNGGEKTAVGPGAVLGIDFASTHRFSIFLEGQWRGSVPDEAIDGLAEDTGLDHLLSVDVGVRMRLTQPKNPRFSVELDIPDTVLVGDISVLRAHVTGDPSSEVYLSWQVEQTSTYRGPEVRHVFDYLGPQTITVAGRNDRYEVRTSAELVVAEDVRYRNPDDPLVAAQPSTEGRVRIVEIYGERSPVVDEPLNYRVRLHPGAIWPVNYLWDMGDGTRLIGNNVLQRYREPGNYRVTVVARNRLSEDTLSTQVLVRPTDVGMDEQAEQAETGREAAAGTGPIRGSGYYSPDELRGAASVASSAGGYGWVVGTYLDRASAEALMRGFKVKGFRTGIVVDSRPGASTAYRVVVGQFASTSRALAAKREVQRLVATPLTIIDIADPSVAVGARPVAERQPVPPPATADADTAATDEADVEAPPLEPVPAPVPVENSPEADTRVRFEADAADLKPAIPGPQLRPIKVYLRDERLLIFVDGITDRNHGIKRVEYRVFAEDGSQLSNWSEMTLVPPGRSSYGLQMHRVPVPEGLRTGGGTVEVRAVNMEGGFSTTTAAVGSE